MGVIDESPVELRIEGLAAGGRGVARHQGVVWFVSGGLPGDRILAVPRRRKSRFVEAARVAIVEPSELRRDAPCAIQDACGGCPWMPLVEDQQRDWKRRLVRDSLERIGGLADLEVDPVVAEGPGLGYRNKVELVPGRDPDGRPVLGFHGAGGLADVPRCPLQHDSANQALDAVRRILLPAESAWSAFFDPGRSFRLVLRRSWLTGEILVAVRESGVPFPAADEFAQRLVDDCPDVRGVARIVGRPGRRGGARVERILGQDWIDERIGELTFRLPAISFLQVSTVMAGELVKTVIDRVGEPGPIEVLDLYGGVGSIGLHLALGGSRVTVCEADRTAVACGRRTARKKGLTRAAFVTGDVRAFLKAADRAKPGTETIVANPPRDGLGRGVADAILAREPRDLVLVSCDPPTLARDLARIVRGGFAVTRVTPLDMFPQTAHVETVVHLRRTSG